MNVNVSSAFGALVAVAAIVAAVSCASVPARPVDASIAPHGPERADPIEEDSLVAQAAEELRLAAAEENAQTREDVAAQLTDTQEDEVEGESQEYVPLDELAVTPPEPPPEELAEEMSLAESQTPAFDIPVVVNDKVIRWLDYYSGAQSEKFLPGLIRSGRYLPMIRRIFREEGLPEDLAYMAHVESAYKPKAYSRARAKGMFQFILSTGRRYGLRRDYWVDERSDPEMATRAAAAYLKDLHAEFGDWYLALAAYNAGEGKIRKALSRTGRTDFWGIARTRYIRTETKNYVPAILAAALISKDPGKYGFEFTPEPPLEYDVVAVEGAADLRVLAECAGASVEALEMLNPALRRGQTPPERTTEVRVPSGTGEATIAALEKVPPEERVVVYHYVVRRGDTLSQIAARHRTSVSAIQQANRMGRRTLLRIGQELVIPAHGGYVPVAEAFDDEPVAYRVKRGDTLSGIALRYRTTATAIAAASGIGVNKTLRVGERLTVYPGVRNVSRSAPESDAVIHVVERGDSLWEVAERYGTTSAAIAAASGIRVNKTLQIGERLVVYPGARRVPESGSGEGPVTYVVRRGDTLWRIAARYSTSVDTLCTLNGISRNTTLFPGTTLRVRAE